MLGGQNGFSLLLQAPYTFGGRQNGHYNTLCGGQSSATYTQDGG